jgi:hypothetical protein
LRPKYGRNRLLYLVGIDPFDARHVVLPLYGVRDTVLTDVRTRWGAIASRRQAVPTIWPLSGTKVAH